MAFFDWFRKNAKQSSTREARQTRRLRLFDQLCQEKESQEGFSRSPLPFAIELQIPQQAIPILWAFRAWGLGNVASLSALSELQTDWAKEEFFAVRSLCSETLRYLRDDPGFQDLSPWAAQSSDFFDVPAVNASGEAKTPEDLAIFLSGAFGGWVRTLLAFAIDESALEAARRIRETLGLIPFSQYDALGRRFSMYLPYLPKAEAFGVIAELTSLGLLHEEQTKHHALHYVEARLLSKETEKELSENEEGLRFPEPLRLGRLARILAGRESHHGPSRRRRTTAPIALIGRLIALECSQIDDVRNFDEKPDDEVVRSIRDQIWLFEQANDPNIIRDAVKRYLLQGFAFEPAIEDDAVLPRELRRCARAAGIEEVIPSEWFNE